MKSLFLILLILSIAVTMTFAGSKHHHDKKGTKHHHKDDDDDNDDNKTPYVNSCANKTGCDNCLKDLGCVWLSSKNETALASKCEFVSDVETDPLLSKFNIHTAKCKKNKHKKHHDEDGDGKQHNGASSSETIMSSTLLVSILIAFIVIIF